MKKILLAAFALLTLVACEKQQSEMQLDGKVATATITGRVTYNPGGENGKMIPADSVEVRAIVANAQYSAGATGNMQIKPVRTNKDGFYSITIPVGQVTIAGVDVQVVPFESEYTDPNSGVKQTVFYTSDPVGNLNLNAGDVKNVDIEMRPEFTFKDYVSSVKISGTVRVDAGINKTSTGYEKALVPYANSELKVKGRYLVDGSYVERDLKDVKTNADGEYSFDVPAGENYARVTISTVRFDGKYTKDNNGEYKTVDVYYDVAQLIVNFSQVDVEMRNQDIVVNSYDEASDISRNFTIKEIKAVVKTLGEVYDEELAGDEELDKYKFDYVFLPFDVKLTLSCPNYSSDYPTSPIADNKLIFTAKASSKDGSVSFKDLKVYSEWEDYTIVAEIDVEDMLKPMPHTYYEFSGFSNAEYKKKTWAAWHGGSVTYDPLVNLIDQFWTKCWPSVKKTQQVEGYYYLPNPVTENIPSQTLHYYGEYAFTNDALVDFSVRDGKSIMGIWSNVNYNTRNDKDDDGNYTPFKVTDEAVDADGVKLTTSVSSSTHKIRQHDKYQGVCRTTWQSVFPSLY